MPPIEKQRLDEYRALADRGLWDIDEPAFRDFYARAKSEGVDLVGNNFSTLGMFRAPHRKSLDGVDITLTRIPMDIVGADLMELSPPWDAGGMSACLASGLAFEMLCLLAECHARRSGRTRQTHWRE